MLLGVDGGGLGLTFLGGSFWGEHKLESYIDLSLDISKTFPSELLVTEKAVAPEWFLDESMDLISLIQAGI